MVTNDDYKAARGAICGSEPAESVIRRIRDGQEFDVATLRAEVQRLRDEQYAIITTPGTTPFRGQASAAKSFAFQAVLDLIDNQREAQ